MSRWDQASARQSFGERPQPSFWQLGMTAYLVMALLITVALYRVAAPSDAVGPNYPAFVAQLAPGQTLWDLAQIYARGHDPRAWVARVKQINGWTHIPNLRPGKAFVAVMWDAEPAGETGR